MEFRQLQCFIALAKHGNFTRAAEELFIAQSTLSYQIAELEAELGIKLFYRTNRTVELLPAGRVFYTEATALFEQYNRCLSVTIPFRSGHSGQLRLAMLNQPERTFLPQFVSYFSRKYPNISLDMVTATYPEMFKMADKREIDVAITLLYARRSYPNLNRIKFNSDHLALIVFSDSPWGDIDSFDDPRIAQLLAAPCYLYDGWYNDPETINFLHSYTEALDITYLDSVVSILIKVMACKGYTLLPCHFAQFFAMKPNQYHTIPLPDPYCALDLCFVQNKSKVNPCVPLLFQEITNFLDSHQSKPLFTSPAL